LWAFGHGLSYTNYSYSSLAITNADATAGAIGNTSTVAVSCDVENTGPVAGTEVVQVYVRDMIASVTTPKLALKAFERVHLAPGQRRTVRMTIDVAEQLKIMNREWKWVVEPGQFKVWVGQASDNTQLTGAFNVTA
jgi:beta-glucosidase